ncbi:hypothetical protein L204_105565 [Cryptococcus depauperatus]
MSGALLCTGCETIFACHGRQTSWCLCISVLSTTIAESTILPSLDESRYNCFVSFGADVLEFLIIVALYRYFAGGLVHRRLLLGMIARLLSMSSEYALEAGSRLLKNSHQLK